MATLTSSYDSGPHDDAALVTWLVRVSGRVQGVGFREACVRRAHRVHVTGWIRNRMDETVEALLQGTRQQVTEMSEWLRDGVDSALVEGLEVQEMAPPFPRFDRFDRLPTL